MTCTTAVFTLMSGATCLGCAALYFHYSRVVENFKVKMNSFNLALSSLQEERHSLIKKNEIRYLENASQTVEIEKLNEEIVFLRTSLERLENDNRLLMREYSSLETQRTVFNGKWTTHKG